MYAFGALRIVFFTVERRGILTSILFEGGEGESVMNRIVDMRQHNCYGIGVVGVERYTWGRMTMWRCVVRHEQSSVVMELDHNKSGVELTDWFIVAYGDVLRGRAFHVGLGLVSIFSDLLAHSDSECVWGWGMWGVSGYDSALDCECQNEVARGVLGFSDIWSGTPIGMVEHSGAEDLDNTNINVEYSGIEQGKKRRN
ncbi:hypothetical protein Tco_1193938 [Tanacetum coccineum]